MANQASVIGNRFARPEGVFGSLGELGNDVATLAELQAKLAVLDTREVVGQALWPSIGLGVSAIVLVTTLPVVLVGLGLVLARQFSLWPGAGLLIVGLVVLVVAAIVGYLASVRFFKSFASYRRSREELVRNVSWVRTVLTQSSKPIQRVRG